MIKDKDGISHWFKCVFCNEVMKGYDNVVKTGWIPGFWKRFLFFGECCPICSKNLERGPDFEMQIIGSERRM